jgi:hypothetical protein
MGYKHKMTERTKRAWQRTLAFAEAEDPALAPLVRAVAGTSLGRLYPVTAVNTLSFAARDQWWLDQSAQALAPVAIALLGDTGGYAVVGFSDLHLEQERLLQTKVPQEAAEKAALLLAEWPETD